MPLFQFRCKKCGEVIEEVYSINSKKRKLKCKCGGEAIRLLGTGTAVKWEVPPGGAYFATVGKHCNTRPQYEAEADKVKKKWVKQAEDRARPAR